MMYSLSILFIIIFSDPRCVPWSKCYSKRHNICIFGTPYCTYLGFKNIKLFWDIFTQSYLDRFDWFSKQITLSSKKARALKKSPKAELYYFLNNYFLFKSFLMAPFCHMFRNENKLAKNQKMISVIFLWYYRDEAIVQNLKYFFQKGLHICLLSGGIVCLKI